MATMDSINSPDTLAPSSFPEPAAPAAPAATNGWETFKETAVKIAKFIEDILWKYIKEAGNIAKRTIKLVVLTVSEISSKIAPVITKIGILSGFSALLALKATYGAGASLAENIRLKDAEGIAWSTLSLIVNPLDALDSIITTMDALAAFGAIPQVAAFSLIALPLAIGLVGFATIKGIYDLIMNAIHFSSFPKALSEENLDSFREYLKSKIGVTAEEKEALEKQLEKQKAALSEGEFEKLKNKEIAIVKDRKKNIISRQADAKVYNIMKNMKKMLKDKSADLTTANLALDDMKTIMARKITWGSFSALTNLAFVTTLACSAVFPISVFALPAVAGARAVFQIGKHHYDHVWLHHGLNLPHLAASA